MQIRLGHLNHILIKVMDGILTSIMIVCLLAIYVTSMLVLLPILIVYCLCGALTLCYHKHYKLLNRGGSNIKQWVLLGRNKIKRVWECLLCLGYWTRGNPEMCLLATKGSPKRLSKSVKQLVISPRREHSRN